MLTIHGPRSRQFCDGHVRRSFLKIGALGLGGLTLPGLLRAESQSKRGTSNRSIIMVYLPGGPPHQDMYDIKIDAPSRSVASFALCQQMSPAFRSANTYQASRDWLTSWSSFERWSVPRIVTNRFNA